MSRSDLYKKVGDFVTEVHTTINIGQTVDQALFRLRNQKIEDKFFYFYVVDDEGHLKGIVSTRSLLLNLPETSISSIMEEKVITISSSHTLSEALERLNQHRLLALPVIDEKQRLLGIIDIQLYLEEVVDIAKARRESVDIFQILGLTLEEGKPRSVWGTYKIRMPWIICNMVGGISCAIISGIFEGVLMKVLLLAFFIPLVLTLSESISMQSMTYSLHLLHRPRISMRRIFTCVFSEWKMVMLLGLTCGLVVGSVSLLWRDGIPPAISIAIGIFISVTISATIGAAIPLILHAKKLDPKVAAGPIVLTLVDVITTTIYLGLSTLFLM